MGKRWVQLSVWVKSYKEIYFMGEQLEKYKAKWKTKISNGKIAIFIKGKNEVN